MSLQGKILCFYCAYLFRLPTINSAATIQNYSNNLKSAWSKMGILISEFDKSVYLDILKGTKRLLPQKPDTRPAFLLPHLTPPRIFISPITSNQLLLKAAVIWGFLAMFRYGSYNKLGIKNLFVVGQDGREFPIRLGSYEELSYYFKKQNAISFYFTFSSKYHPIAHAFFCKLSSQF